MSQLHYLHWFILLLLTYFDPSYVQAQRASNVSNVNTTTGTYQGFQPYPGVHAYLGMRYAEPPVGNLRFEPPRPYKPNHPEVAIDASGPFAGCYQMLYNTILSDKMAGSRESEDCLFINVWKPSNASTNASLPVVIWIYGGGFAEGASTSYDGVGFVAEHQDVIFVSFK